MKYLLFFCTILTIYNSNTFANSLDNSPKCRVRATELRYYKPLLGLYPNWFRWSFGFENSSLKLIKNENNSYQFPKDLRFSFYGLKNVVIDLSSDKMSLMIDRYFEKIEAEAPVEFKGLSNPFDYEAEYKIEFKPKFPKIGIKDRGIEILVNCYSNDPFI